MMLVQNCENLLIDRDSMNSAPPIRQAILELWPLELWLHETVVVAVSGGADSTALLEALVELRPDPDRTIVAHFNHALRGQESDADQAFVESLSCKHGLKCTSQKATLEQTTSRSENQLRKLRHRFLEDVAKQHRARWIALAHHADDQVETFLHHLLRGSGPSGLSGMSTIRPINATTNLVRPLLRVVRSQILEYLSSRNQTYHTDKSNASNDYTRNRIRNELLPQLRMFVGSDSLDNRLLHACELIAKEHRVVTLLAERWLQKAGLDAGERKGLAGDAFSIPLRNCIEEPWPVVRHALTILWHKRGWPMREMGHTHWQRIERLIEIASKSTHPKRLDLPGHIVVRCRKGNLFVDRLANEPSAGGDNQK